jgi:hypothetical protein
MTDRLQKNCYLLGRLGIVLVTAGAIIVSGADAAARLFSAYQAAEEANEYSLDQVDITPVPGEATGEMATTTGPDGEPTGLLLVPLHVQGFGPNPWPSLPTCILRGENCCDQSKRGDRPLHCSLSQISTRLGARQRLLGAKPSGTG